MVASDTLRRHLEQLESFTAELRKLEALEPDRYTEQEAYAGRYLIQAATQCSIDMANHVIASEGWPTPSDYRSAFGILADHEVLDPDLAERMKALAGLRNRLVHIYDDIDDRLIHESLEPGLRDLDQYARAIARLTTDM